MKTYTPRPRDIERRWYLIDAGGVILGRLATQVAAILRGKHKPIFAPHMDVGDHLIIINAAKVVLTGGKEKKKVAWLHSGHPGGITGTPAALPTNWKIVKKFLVGPAANLINANFTNANFSGTNLTLTKLAGAVLTGVISGGITGAPATLPTNWKVVYP